MKLNRSVNIKIIIMVIVIIALLIGGVYAWFINFSKVSMKLRTNVKSWKIEFTYNEAQVENNIELDIEEIYPGMEDKQESILVKNLGDINAKIDYKIESFSLFGEEYSIEKGYTDEELKNMIKEFPFEIKCESTKDVIGKNEESNFIVTFKWSYGDESNEITEKDELDTKYGQLAYNYKMDNSQNDNNESQYNFSIKIRLIAKQSEIDA